MVAVTFGMIVLNGEPFLRYNYRALYPFAHQIIVVEGAVPAAAGAATPDGHSTDQTLQVLRHLKAEEDPEDKLTIVQAEDEGYPNGFWPVEKHEESRAYARRATGDYLWQVDADEFYHPEAMHRVLEMVASDPDISGMSFSVLRFWGGLGYVTDGWYCRQYPHLRRFFRWGPGYQYASHRPPTVIDERGRNMYDLRWVHGDTLRQRDIALFHYLMLLPQQAREKCQYYGHVPWGNIRGSEAWARDSFFSLKHPFHVHNTYRHPSWLERYDGPHPPEVVNLWEDIRAGRLDVELRPTEDVERLLSSRSYATRRRIVDSGERFAPLYYFYRRATRPLRGWP